MSGSTRETLYSFTPLPPARNGIADYAALLLAEMVRERPCAVFCEEGFALPPAGVTVCDSLQAFRYLTPEAAILHQIGNNGGHVFVMEALRRHGGVVSLHDLSLLYLYELMTPRLEPILAGMVAGDARLGGVFARHWKERRLKTAANYVLFDMTAEVLGRADAVIVHSRYAQRKLAALHGAAATAHVAVIPHFAPKLTVSDRAAARARFGYGADEIVLLTSGFATRAKRFDWMLEAAAALAEEGIAFRWVHAGEERVEEFALRRAIAERPALAARCRVTGYCSEEDLDAHILAADVVVNLRFPSVGESSGTLARAFSAGRCTIVNDTAAYAELPRDAVVHVPVFGSAAALARALRALIADAALREDFGQRARLFAEGELSIGSVARRYLAVIDESRDRRAKRERRDHSRRPSSPALLPLTVESAGRLASADIKRRFVPPRGRFEAVLWFESAEEIAERSLGDPGFLADMLGTTVAVDSMRFVTRPPAPGGSIGLVVVGEAFR